MKQHITGEQWDELVERYKVKTIGDMFKLLKLDLNKYHNDVHNSVKPWEYVTIGKMIEIINEDSTMVHFTLFKDKEKDYQNSIVDYWEGCSGRDKESKELCDSLLEVVKEVLSTEGGGECK